MTFIWHMDKRVYGIDGIDGINGDVELIKRIIKIT